MTTDVRAILEYARMLITRAWTQGVSARDKDGATVPALDPAAVTWCPIGAVIRASHTLKAGKANEREASDVLWDTLDGRQVQGWNDAPERTHAEVIALFNRALEQ